MRSCSPAFARARGGSRSANRTAATATALVERFADVGAGARSAVALADPAFETALRSADLAVNATTVGMLDPGVTIPVDVLPATATVFDLVYVPPETPLLAAARARGLRAANGSEMLIAAGRDRVRALDRRRPAWPTSCARPSRRCSPTPTSRA